MRSFEILCPALLAPPVDLDAADMPDTPALSRLLARADQRPNPLGDRPSSPAGSKGLDAAAKAAAGRSLAPDPLAALFDRAGLACSPDHPPSAPIALLGEGKEVEPGSLWFHADPVHLRPDRDRLRLYAGRALAPEPDEAEALVKVFNCHFAEEGFELLAPRPERWYLRVYGRLPQLQMAPIYAVQGGSIGDHLPRDANSLPWVRLLNEAQMLFHAEPGGRLRAKTGQPAINGIWIWGGGILPAQVKLRVDCLVGDMPAVRGLARLGLRPCLGLDEWLADPLASKGPGGRYLLFWDRHWRAALDQDPEGWIRASCQLDPALARLEQALGRGGLAEIWLDPLQGPTFVFRPHHRWRLWRRPGPIGD